MQDEVNEKTVALCINGGKISGRILKAAMVKALAKMNQSHSQRTAQKNTAIYHGKQSMEKLMRQNCELTNIEVTDKNIRPFEKYARKYNIDFSLKKDTSVTPPRYLVFFKARDADVMQAAFKAYTSEQLTSSKKPSLRKKLQNALDRAAHRQRTKSKDKERGPEL